MSEWVQTFGGGMEQVGGRVLTAAPRDGGWEEYDDSTESFVPRHGRYWTVIDRDTGELIGSFGFEVQVGTREEALDEAERFGSKWDWPCDREWTDGGDDA